MSRRYAARTKWEKVQRPRGEIHRVDLTKGRFYLTGVVVTSFGFVSVYSEFDAGEKRTYDRTNLRFIYGGFIYRRAYSESYSATYLVTLANRFASDIVEDNL